MKRYILSFVSVLGLVLSAHTMAATLSGQIMHDEVLFEGATVKLISANVAIDTTTVDTYGNYEFSDVTSGNYRLQVIGSGISTAASTVAVGETDATHNIWLVSAPEEVETFTIIGKVKDYNNDTYPNTTVIFTNQTSYTSYTTTTNQFGNYSIQLPAGEYSSSLNSSQNLDVDEDETIDGYLYFYFDDYFDHFDVSANGNQNFLLPIKQVNIDAIDGDNEVATNTTVGVSDSIYDSEAGQYRYFSIYTEINNTLVDTKLVVEHLYSFVLKPNSQSDEGPFPTAATAAGLNANTSLETITQTLNSTGIVFNATFKDLQNNLLSDACIALTAADGSAGFDDCATDGSLTLYVPEGQYYLGHNNYNPAWDTSSAYSQFYFDGYEDLSFALDEGQTTTINQNLVVPVFILRGQVTDEQGQPVANATVSLPISTGSVDYDTGTTGYIQIQHDGVLTDSNGHYELYVSQYANSLLITPPEGSPLLSQFISMSEVNMGAATNVVLTEYKEPTEGLTVYGKVHNIGGDGVLASVQLYNNSSALVASTTTSANGSFQLDAPATGQYRLTVSNGTFGYGLPLATYGSNLYVDTNYFNVNVATQRDVLVPLFMIQGRVMDNTGKAVPGVELQSVNGFSGLFQQYTSGNFPAVSDEYGRFYMPGLLGAENIRLTPHLMSADTLIGPLSPVQTNQSMDVIYLGSITLADDDNNGLPDIYEGIVHYGNPVNPVADYDGDGVLNSLEYRKGTDIHGNDTDNDGILDNVDSNPVVPYFAETVDLNQDTDEDETTDWQEYQLGSDPDDETDFPKLIADYPVADSELQACIDEEAGQYGYIYVQQVTNLFCYNYRDVTTIAGIEQYRNLTDLSINGESVSDLSPITLLTKLTSLNVYSSNIQNIEPVGALSQLTRLSFWSQSSINSIDVLRDLTQLTMLQLNPLIGTDLSPLNALVNLNELYLYSSDYSGLGFLDLMPNLEYLTLSNFPNVANKIYKIASHPNLIKLSLEGTPLNDLNFLASLTTLTDLSIGNTGVTDLSRVNNMTNLSRLSLEQLGLTNVDAVVNLSNLVWLQLSSNNIDDLSGLENLVNLENLYLYGNNLSTLYSIKDLQNIDYINVGGNEALICITGTTNFSSLDDIPESCFEEPADSDEDGFTDNEELALGTDPDDENDFPLLISENQVADEQLQACIDQQASNNGYSYTQQVTQLSCDGYNIASLNGIAHYSNITYLEFIDSSLSDLSPLASLSSLTNLGLWENTGITSIAALSGLTQLTSLSISPLTDIADLSPLNNLVNLTQLWIGESDTDDLAFLDYMPNLRTLSLQLFTNIAGETAKIAALTKLTTLELGGASLDNIDFVQNMTSLQRLGLYNTGIESLSPVSNLTNLRELNAQWNNITDITPLTNLTGLEYLYLDHNNIVNILPLQYLTNLDELYLADNEGLECDVSSMFTSIDDVPDSCFFAGGSLFDVLDIDRNNKDDLLLLGNMTNGKQAIMLFDSVTGLQTQGIILPGWFSGDQATAISDINGNSFNDIAVLGSTSDGKKAWVIFDGSSKAILGSLAFPAWFQPSQLQVVPDFNDNDKVEILVLGETTDGKKVWMLHDGGLRSEMARYIYPSWYQPASISVLQDTDGNGKPEVASVGLASDNRATWMVYDLYSKTQIRAVKEAAWFSIDQLLTLDDVSGNTLDDVLWLGHTTDNKNLFRIADANSGGAAETYTYPGWFTPLQVSSQIDHSGNGFAEVVSLGSTSDGKKAWLAHDADTQQQVAAKVFPAWYQPTHLQVINDVNDDGTQDIVVQGTTTDNKVVIMVQDGISGADIKVIILPSWFSPIAQ